MNFLQSFFLIIINIIFTGTFLLAQERQDVIYLNNGDILKGIIIENVPMDYVRIELKGGSILTYKYSQIKKFTKEIAIQNKQSSLKENTTTSSPTIIVQQQQQQQQQEEKQITRSPIIPQQNNITAHTDRQKMMMYEDQKKSPTTAGFLSFLLSSTGHAYAGNWGRGLLFLGGRIASVMLINAGLAKNTVSYEYDYYGNLDETVEEGGNELITIGVVSLIGLAVWEIFDAVSETKKYNRRLYNRIYNDVPDFGFNLVPTKGGARLSLTYNF